MIHGFRNRSVALSLGMAIGLCGWGSDAGAQEKLLEDPMVSVTFDKELPPSGDPRDYRSLAIYWWPNAITGIPYYRRDGIRNPEAANFDHPKLNRMVRQVNRLTDAWRSTQDERFAVNAADRCRVWFLDPETRMNPNLNFAQFIPGIRRGSYHGIVEANILAEDFLDNLAELMAGGLFSEEEAEGLREWFSAFLTWLEESRLGRIEDRQKSNQSLWYDFQRVRFARFIGDDDRARTMVRESGPRRIDLQIEPDGRMPAEMERTKSFGYVCYALRALVQTAREGDELGEDLWNYQGPKGASIGMALRFAARHAHDPDAWPGRQIEPLKPQALLPLIDLYLEKVDDQVLHDAREKLFQAMEARED